MPRKDPVTKGTARLLDPPWDWRCERDHHIGTPAGITPVRCPVGPCTSRKFTPVSPDGNPIRKPRS